MARTQRQEELLFGAQMDHSDEKLKLVQKVVDAKRTNVLDLGAGTGILSRLISEKGIKCSAVDNNFKVDEYHNGEFITYYPVDLIKFVSNTDEKFDCVILSAVLHELPKEDYKFLQKNLKKIITKDCLILIREPYYEKVKVQGEKNYYRPFKSYNEQQKAVKKIITLTPDDFSNSFNMTPKISEVHVPFPVKILSMSFTYSYGKDSWEREKNEYRYTFSLNKLLKFCRKTLGNECVIKTETFDESYRKHFNECGYTDDILNSVEYTNCLIEAKGN